MVDNAELFANKFYSPELEKRPQDRLGNELRNLKSQGYKIFSTVLDFDARHPLWSQILENFSESSMENIALVLHAPNRFSYQEIQSRLAGKFNSREGKLIFAIRSQNDLPFSLDSLLETDVLITTKAFSSSLAIDYLSGTNFKTFFAMDGIKFA